MSTTVVVYFLILFCVPVLTGISGVQVVAAEEPFNSATAAAAAAFAFAV